MNTQTIVDGVINSRYSCRAFLPQPVPHETVADILRVASRAPSGTNTQPWKVAVVTGEKLKSLTDRMSAAFDDPEEATTHSDPYAYYPKKWISPYIERRRKVGLDLYGLLGIVKGDAKRMHEQHGKNYKFFGAPVALVFTVDTIMEQGSWLDYGMFVQTVMLAAKARGLDTCPQAAPLQFHRIIRDQLQLPENETMVCAMSLGYADTGAVENTLRTERAPLEEWVRFLD
ncbi:MAG: nitroreductase [Rhodocyclaceae bacterium]|nr:nitroreductase [Rhodocyclaceae bacterium]